MTCMGIFAFSRKMLVLVWLTDWLIYRNLEDSRLWGSKGHFTWGECERQQRNGHRLMLINKVVCIICSVIHRNFSRFLLWFPIMMIVCAKFTHFPVRSEPSLLWCTTIIHILNMRPGTSARTASCMNVLYLSRYNTLVNRQGEKSRNEGK